MDRQSVATALLCLVVLTSTSVGAGAGIATAEDDDGVLEPIRTVTSWFEALRGAAWGEIQQRFTDPADRDAAEAAADLKAEYNASSDDIEGWVNDRVDADADADVLAVTVEIDDDEETVFLVADVDGSDYANSSMVDSTDRSVDERCTLEDDAARNAADELEAFVEEFVDEDRDASSFYLGRTARRYDGDVDCTFDLNP